MKQETLISAALKFNLFLLLLEELAAMKPSWPNKQ